VPTPIKPSCSLSLAEEFCAWDEVAIIEELIAPTKIDLLNERLVNILNLESIKNYKTTEHIISA